MTQHSIPLGKNLRDLDYSWFVIFALLTWMLAGSYYPEEFKHWSPLLYWLMGAVTAIMLFASVLLHELGHSVVALQYKIPVRSMADVQRQFWWALGCVDRLVPGQRGFRSDTADDVSGSTDGPSRFASHERIAPLFRKT